MPRRLPYNAFMTWIEDVRDGVTVMRPSDTPEGLVVAFSGRGHAPEGEETPTAWLSRRFSRAIGLDGTPIHWAHQVHGNDAVTVRTLGRRRAQRRTLRRSRDGSSRRGARRPDRGLRSDPARGARACRVGAAHAGWRGSAKKRRAPGRPRSRSSRRRAIDSPRLDRPCHRPLLLRRRRRRRGPVRRRLRPIRTAAAASSGSTSSPSTSPSSWRPACRAPRSPCIPPARSAAATSSRATAATDSARAG